MVEKTVMIRVHAESKRDFNDMKDFYMNSTGKELTTDADFFDVMIEIIRSLK